MRTLHPIAILLSAFCGAVIGADTPNPVDTFSKLKRGDTLVVRFHTTGCFHDETHEFTFRRAAELTVAVVQLPRDAARAGLGTTQTNRVDVGTLTLSKSDVAGLDRLMEYYRSKHDGFCTTVDRISFTQQRDGKTIATEEITDGSCQTFRMKRLMTFPGLVGRLPSPKR
jgi:hypothetical protein